MYTVRTYAYTQLWNHYHNQGNRQNHYLQNFLVFLCFLICMYRGGLRKLHTRSTLFNVEEHDLVLTTGSTCTACLQKLFIFITKILCPLKKNSSYGGLCKTCHLAQMMWEILSESTLVLRKHLLREKLYRVCLRFPNVSLIPRKRWKTYGK